MDFMTVIKKAVLGFLTFVTAYLATNPEMIINLLPANIATMTIGGAVAALIVALANYLKHMND